jgi:hypothetical protein
MPSADTRGKNAINSNHIGIGYTRAVFFTTVGLQGAARSSSRLCSRHLSQIDMLAMPSLSDTSLRPKKLGSSVSRYHITALITRPSSRQKGFPGADHNLGRSYRLQVATL